jgi:HK97 family phage prohead protease
MKVNIERRFVEHQIEVRSLGGRRVVEGYAAVYNSISSDLGGFREVIPSSRTFAKTIKEADIRALFNHDPNFVMGRNRAGTLDLASDSKGLAYRIRPADTSYFRDLDQLLERGDVSNSSFAGYFISDDWRLDERGYPLREVREVRLVDISVVTYPAYEQTSARNGAMQSLARRSGLSVVELGDAESVRRAVMHEPSDEQRDAARRELAAIALEDLDDLGF